MNQENRPGRRANSPRPSRHLSLYLALLDSLEQPDRQWVVDVVARQRLAEHEGDLTGEPHPRAMW